MAQKDVKEVTERALQKGGLLTKLYFDMQSEKSEDLQPLMSDLLNNRLLKEPGVLYCFGSIDEPIKVKEVYSTNAIVTVLFKDLGALINVVFNYSPAGIDLLKPQGSYVISAGDLNGVLLSLSQISAEYSKYILTKVMSGADLEKVNRELKAREDLGKKLIGSSSPGQSSKKEPPKD